MILIKLRNKPQWFLFVISFLLSAELSAEPIEFDLSGHTKARFTGQAYSENSLFYTLTGSESLNTNSDLRLNFEVDSGPWRFESDYQLFTLYGDQVEYSRSLPAFVGSSNERFISDNRRTLSMTKLMEDHGKFAALHRFDRLSLSYSGDKAVVKIGRQALSWGNGIFFSPMDIINPFDPTAIDTEYKAGDDMLYIQYLMDNGSDLQGAAVARRNPITGHAENDQGTYAIKYHGFLDQNEYDILLAQSYDNLSLGIGGNRSLGGAVWQTDLVLTETDTKARAQLVTNLSYSWRFADHNMTGLIEYYHNGFGQGKEQYEPLNLIKNPELLKKLERGEVFTLGKHYLAGGVSIEMTPLWVLSPNLFTNLEDHSALLQIVSQTSLGNNLTFLSSLNIPLGPNGSEFGGIETGLPAQYFSTDFGVFAQLSWYF